LPHKLLLHFNQDEKGRFFGMMIPRRTKNVRSTARDPPQAREQLALVLRKYHLIFKSFRSLHAAPLYV
jgi:hypothetical protein